MENYYYPCDDVINFEKTLIKHSIVWDYAKSHRSKKGKWKSLPRKLSQSKLNYNQTYSKLQIFQKLQNNSFNHFNDF